MLKCQPPIGDSVDDGIDVLNMHSSWLSIIKRRVQTSEDSIRSSLRSEQSAVPDAGVAQDIHGQLVPSSTVHVVGIDDTLASVATPEPEQSHGKPSGAQQRARAGRPRGTVGNAVVRGNIRALALPVVAQASIAAPVSTPASGSSAHFRQHSSLEHFKFLNVGTPLQQQLYLFAAQQHKSKATADESENIAQQYLFSGRRIVTSLKAIAERVDRKEREEARRSQRLASACVQGGSYLWGSFFATVKDMITKGPYEGLLLGCCRRYDETPHKIRIAEQGTGGMTKDSLGVQAKTTGTAAKVFQSRFGLFFLVRHAHSKRYMLLTGQVPCPLQTIDSGTAENIRFTQERVMGLVTGLWGLAPLFRYRVSLVAWPVWPMPWAHGLSGLVSQDCVSVTV